MKKWGLVVLSLLLTGCGTKFVYNNLDWLLIEYLDDFVELTTEQEALISDKLDSVTEWHKQQELPRYIQHLNQLIALDPKKVTLADIQRQETELKAHTQRLLRHIASDISILAKQLSDQQVEELVDSIRVRHTRYKRKYQKLSESEIRENYQERLTDNIQDWLGPLTSEQKRWIADWTSELYVTSYDWIDHQTKMRIEINQLLSNRLDDSYFEPHFEQLMFNPTNFYSKELQQKIAHNRATAHQHLVKIINSISDKQMAHYRQELKDWRDIALEIHK
ncbi:DUF6279 family lipoprotein [Vibrio tetraodonis]|uniref:DUF6279 family lipoprotein n=1 Tax=Vibrio tetraodonis TaxID=2231647 RepID=UPI000E0BF61E|nr:DUF6279 family lipoprotein [Vibrio tetraodonis]